MTYSEATDFLFTALPVWEKVAGSAAYKPGLERITKFLETLGNPHLRVKTVHIAGTNGKGSTASMLSAVLQSSGYKTGLFTSPHLVDFRERIRVNGQKIPEQKVVEFTEKYREKMVSLGLTFFEMTTAMAFWFFDQEKCDVAIIEAGLGGRLDSTNVITPLVSVITNVGLEHTQYLGDTVAAIAAEKAGIIKLSVPVVVGETDAESEPVFRAKSAEMNAPVIFAQHEGEVVEIPLCGGVAAKQTGWFEGNLELDLQGTYQLKNLKTVLAAVEILRKTFPISAAAVKEGLAHTASLTGLAGRWQIIDTQPLTVLDTAHNAHGFAEIKKQIDRQKFQRLFMVLGFAGDKNVDEIIKFLPKNAYYILTVADTPRAMPVDILVQKFANFTVQKSVETARNVQTAVEIARQKAAAADMIYIGGSNFVVGELLKNRQ